MPGALPTVVSNSFDSGTPRTAGWGRISLFSLTTSCAARGSALQLNGRLRRYMETVDLDASGASLLQFTLGFLSSGSCATSSSFDTASQLQIWYSTNGGANFTFISSVSSVLGTLSVQLPAAARTLGVRFVLIQPEFSSFTALVFDRIYLGGGPATGTLSAMFASSPALPNIEVAAAIATTCGNVTGAMLASSGDFIELPPLPAAAGTQNMVLQLIVSAGCSDTPAALPRLQVDYTDLPAVSTSMSTISWQSVYNRCAGSSCSSSSYDSITYSRADMGAGIFPLLPAARLGTVRLAVRVTHFPDRRYRITCPNCASSTQLFVVRAVLSSQCPAGCSNRGLCENSTCICDPGFAADAVTGCAPGTQLPTMVMDNFNDELLPRLWTGLLGGLRQSAAQTTCQVLEQNAVVFATYNDAPRMIETQDLNMSLARDIYMVLGLGSSSGTCTGPLSSSVHLAYSLDSGLTYYTLTRTTTSQNSVALAATRVLLPAEVQVPSVRFAVWQTRPPSFTYEGWTLDQFSVSSTNAFPLFAESFAPSANLSLWVSLAGSTAAAGSTCGGTAADAVLGFPGQASTLLGAVSRDVVVGDPVVTVMNDLLAAPTAGPAWSRVSGAVLASTRCGLGAGSLGWFFSTDTAGEQRVAETVDFNLSTSRFSAAVLSFQLAIGASGCDGLDNTNENVTVQFSVNGGQTWTNMAAYTSNMALQTRTLTLSTAARTATTRFRFIQPTFSTGVGASADVWVLRSVQVLGTLPTIYHLQFHARLGCGSAPSDRVRLSVQASWDTGQSFNNLQPTCVFGTNCFTNNQLLDTSLSPWLGATWRRFTIELTPQVVRNALEGRFSWSMESSVASDWALDNIYVGKTCPFGCSGRGNCTAAGCVCDPLFVLDAASGTCVPAPSTIFPSSLLEEFDNASLSPLLWAQHGGGRIQSSSNSPCRVSVGSGNGYVFQLDMTRFLETQDLNLTQATTVIFSAASGGISFSDCNRPSSGQGISVAFSKDGGMNWEFTSYVSETTPPSLPRALPIPAAYRTPATRIMW